MDFLFVGGRLAVDLLNTVIAQDGRVRDLLGRREDVASWGEAAGVVSRRGLRSGHHEPADVRAFREALRRGLVAWATAGRPPARLIALLNHHLALDPAVTELISISRGRRVATRVRSAATPIERLYGAVARSVAELLTSGDPRRLRKCANPTCRLMFYDTSKAGRRRWCSMQTCGSRAKVRAFYRRRRRVTARGGTPPRAAIR
jgi:predicted RNA-binding Zn ribbon-like protein